jgi:methionyl-tRNA formyltransferase
MSIRIIFMGSPDFALPSLESLSKKYEVVGVFTQPDKPSGRGKTITPPPVKELANSLGLQVFQPITLKDLTVTKQVQELKPDLIVVVAFGKLLPLQVLDIPRLGCLNVHASLLPRWRGASPIQAAILHGDQETGVTIMKLGVGLDDGPILSQKHITISSEDTTGTLTDRLSNEGAELLLDTLLKYLNGKITPTPQDEKLVTLAPKIKKEDGLLDFSLSSGELSRRVRAFSPWPAAYFMHQNQTVRVFKVQVTNLSTLKSGQLGKVNGFPAVGTLQGDLVILELQVPGKKKVSGEDFLRGARNWG